MVAHREQRSAVVGEAFSGSRRAVAATIAWVALAACAGADRAEPPIRVPSCTPGSAGAPWLAFSSRRTGNYEIWRARADGTCLAQVTVSPSADLDPSWVGSDIAFASDRGGAAGIWVHHLATGDEAALETPGLASAASPALSPDGTLVAFEGRVGSGAPDVYLIPSAGGTPVALAAHDAADGGPAWSADGARVFFVSTRSGAHEVWSAPAAGGDPEQVTTGSRIVGKPAPTPDGAALLFARTVAGGVAAEVVRLELASGIVAVVTSADDSEPAVAPAGDRVAVRSFRRGHGDVVVLGLDGSGAVALTDDEASDGAPAFAAP
jgi:Tol biopolymer transport system component